MKSLQTADTLHSKLTNLTWAGRKANAHKELREVEWGRVIFVSLFFSICGGIYALYIVPHLGLRIPCPFETIFGVTDAGEGLTSALYQTVHGNFYQAFRLNAMLYIAPPLFVLWYTLKLLYFKLLSRVVLVLAFVIVTMYGVLRNFDAFSYLLPTWV